MIFMLINLKGKTALVTGSLTGIGKSIANADAKIILHGFNFEDVVDQRIRQLKISDNKVEFIYADLNKAEDINYMVRHGMRLFGGIDILVNNAGKQHTQKLVDFPDKTWD